MTIAMKLGRNGKITLVAALVLLLAIGTFAAINQSTIAGKPTSPAKAKWTLRLPSSYSSMKQILFSIFPELTASQFHYYNPNFAGTPPLVSLTINLQNVTVKTTDLVFSQNWHLTASGVDISEGLLIPELKVVRVVCDQLTADINLSPPDAKGVFGTLTAYLEGNVLLSIPDMPGSPIPGYYYQGKSLKIEVTLVEPIYTVTVNPAVISIPQGCNNDQTPAVVTVAPREDGITQGINLRFECNENGINGWIEDGAGTPPYTSTLHIDVQPWVPAGTYQANVVANDYMTGKQFRSNDVSIIVQESGYTVTVNGNNPANLGTIAQGTMIDFSVFVTPWTCYSDGIGISWNFYGNAYGINVGMYNGPSPPPCEIRMYIALSPDAVLGTQEMDIHIGDGNLGRDFVCHVTFEVVSP